MPTIYPYLNFSGQCEEAFRFYAKCLGGEISFMGAYEGSPMEDQVPPRWRKKIMHASLTLKDAVLMGCDPPPGRFEPPKGFSLALTFEKPADAKRIFKALAAKGTITMPFQPTFWSGGFGMLVDRFGIPWMVSCQTEPH